MKKLEDEEYSLIDELQLQNNYQIVAEKNGKIVYAKTTYHELSEEDYENFITEDDEPMDNLFSEKEQRLLIDTLQNASINWTDQDFMACANVAIYYAKNEFVVPDMFLSLNVKHPKTWRAKKDKCYIAWEMGKMPELVLEIVSNKIGKEKTKKMKLYAQLGIKYYVVHDPYLCLSKDELRVYELKENSRYVLVRRKENFMPQINLGIQLWKGLFESEESLWARWCYKDGNVLHTGAERADEEAKRADEEAKRANKEAKRANEETKRANEEAARANAAEEELQKMREQLKALGLSLEPEI